MISTPVHRSPGRFPSGGRRSRRGDSRATYAAIGTEPDLDLRPVAGTEVLVHLRINDVTVKPARIDELGSVLSNKVLPVVNTQTGFQGLLCAANRTTGNCFIVSFWDSKQSVDASEKAIATTRSETIGAVDAQRNSAGVAAGV